MDLPFTPAEFFAVFVRYNQSVWPLQVVLLGSALIAAWLTAFRGPRGATAALIILALLWIWMGVVYQGWFFRSINPAATIFMIVFLCQGLLLLYAAFTRRVEGMVLDSAGLIGGALILYALVVYPALGYFLGHRYPASPTFGLPCPTTLFTLGLLLWMRPVPWLLFIIPLGWAAIGTSAAVKLGVQEDFGLALGGAAALLGVLLARRATTGTAVNRIAA